MTEYRQPDPLADEPTPPLIEDASPATGTGPGAGQAWPPAEEQSLKDRAGEAAQTGKQAAGSVASTAQDKAKDVVAEGKRQARTVVDEAQAQVREQAGAQHRNLVDNLRSLGNELRSMSERSEQNGIATDLVAQAGDHAHTAASWLGDREPGQVVDEVRAFARRRPGLFLAGCLALGVVAGRMTRGVVAVHNDDSGDDPGEDTATGAGASHRTDDAGPLPASVAPVDYPTESPAYAAEVRP